jgi:hypothetical protein
MSRRKEALEKLRAYLATVYVQAEVRVRRLGERNWSDRWQLPGRVGCARAAIVEEIARAVMTLGKGGVVEVEPLDGDGVTSFTWPDGDDLFAAQTMAEQTPNQSQTLVPVEAKREATKECAIAVLKLLFRRQERLTAERMEEELAREEGGYPYSVYTIRPTCTELRARGALDNRRDGRGTGFGLTHWDSDPCPED